MMPRSSVLLAALFLSGCAGAGVYRTPDAPLPPAWQAASATPREAGAPWWSTFHDPALDRLVSAGLAANTDLAAAMARLDQAQAMARGAQAALLPAAQAQGTLARQRQSTESGLGRLTRYVPTLSRTQNQGDIGVAGSWDIDFAGGLSGARDAARGDALAARAGLDAARLALAGEIAQTLIEWRMRRADRALLQQTRANLAQIGALTRARIARGDAAAREGDATDADLAAIDAALPDLDTAIGVARNRLAVLTGRPAGAPLPELDSPELGSNAAIPTATDPGAGVPSDLLRARPDVVMAEARLRASHARIGAALSDYWPKFNLSALFGFSANDLSRLPTDSANVVTGALGLRWRLFDFGRVDAEVAAARGAEREALANWRGAVLNAGSDVENAFLALADARRILAARQDADRAQVALLARAQALQARGETGRAELLAAQNRRIDAARGVLAAQAGVASALVQCHRALGG